MKPKKYFDITKKAVASWVDDFAPSMGAAISYYTMFSLAPMLVIVIAVAGAVFGEEAVRGQIVEQASSYIGQEGAQAVQTLIKSASDTKQGLIAGLISIVVLIVGATTVFAELQSALDRIWHVPASAKPSGIWATLRARLLSFGLVLTLAFLLMVSLVLSAGIAIFSKWTTGLFPGWEYVLQGLNMALSLAITTVLFATIFKYMTTAELRWSDVWVGAGVTAVLFGIGKFALGYYLGRGSVSGSFAAAGSLVVLLTWVYYAAQIFLFGAEFTKVYANEQGSTAGAKAVAATEAHKAANEAGTDAEPEAVAGGAVKAMSAAQAAQVAEVAPDEQRRLESTIKAKQFVEKRVENAASALTLQVALLAATTLSSAVLGYWQKKQGKSRAQAGAQRRMQQPRRHK